MKDSFLQPKPLNGLNPKMILANENKLKNLENRLMGPNNEGKAPSECQPLKESEFENIKTKIINVPLAPKEIKENINTINENNKNKNNIMLKSNSAIKKTYSNEIKTDEKFLQKKRNFGEKSQRNTLEEDFNHDFLNSDKNNSNKSILSDKSFKSDNNSGGAELSQKHNNNNNGNTNNMYIMEIQIICIIKP